MSAVSASTKQLPIEDGAYLSKEHCDVAAYGDLGMVQFSVEKNGREVSFDETVAK